MTELTAFLREQAYSGANKHKRTAMPDTWSTAQEPYAIPIRKALAQKMIFDHMPLFIGERELIVGTRTLYSRRPDNIDGSDIRGYDIACRLPYINEEDIALFGEDQSYRNKTHYTPDYSILLEKGIGGILEQVNERKTDRGLKQINCDFLESVQIAYTGLSNLIRRYSEYASELAKNADEREEKERLFEISRICQKISTEKPDSFREAVQLLWFGHLGSSIESFGGINYGRLDVILERYLKDTPLSEAQQLLDCLLIKMYDQSDLKHDNQGEEAGQLVVTLGGVLANGESAVNDVTMMFLNAIDHVRFPEPEFNLRIHKCNPPEFLDRAAELTISGCNHVSYYNDALFIESMTEAGIPVENAREYAFDLCQDINIPGKSDFYVASMNGMICDLMDLLLEKDDYSCFEELLEAYKERVAIGLERLITDFNQTREKVALYRDGCFDECFNRNGKGPRLSWGDKTPMAPLPYLSALYHGTLENALDLIFEPYPIQEKGFMLGAATEAINSLAAIKKIVFETGQYTLKHVVDACRHNFAEEGEAVMRNILWNAPKWGNDDDYVDLIGKDILEFGLKELKKYKTFSGGAILGGIHQPIPVATGRAVMATPEGRYAGSPVSVTLTPESGTMRLGPTAALKSAAKIDYHLIQWNFCVMVNYFASVFRGNEGKEIFKKLLNGYFAQGGLQHQPNVLDVQELREAQLHPEQYQDLIVRLWGVSAYFVRLPKEMQDEMIARFA